MTQRTDSDQTPLHRLWLQLLLVKGLSWLGVLSLFSSNLVLAQTSPSSDAVVVPTIEDSKLPMVVAPPVAKSVPARSQSTPTSARLERLRQKLSTASTTVRQQPKPQVSNFPTPARRELLRQKSSTATAPARQQQPSTKLPSPAQARRTRLLEKTAINSATEYNNAYIDPTDYSIGATRRYQAPSAVVLSERSTGCKAFLQQGQGVSGSLCGSRQGQTRIAVRRTQLSNGQRTRIAVRRTQLSNTVRLPRLQVPTKLATTSRAVARAISPVRNGPLSVSSTGFHPTRRMPISFQALRPIGQQGNVNSRLMFPLAVPATITSIFGWRIHPITGNRRFHFGTDLGAPLGTPVLAAYAGNVALADFLGGYGLTVVLNHNKFTQQTLYAHLSEIFVQPGEWVEQGTVIGLVGSTGNSTGSHLHFETRQLTPEGWVAIDPGVQLEFGLAQLVEALRVPQSTRQPEA